MNKKQILTLLVLAAIVGAVGILFYDRQTRSWQSTGKSIGQPVLKNFPYNEVGLITISDGTNSVHLKRNDGRWCVVERYNYPANYTEIRSLLLKLAELKAVQIEEVGASQRWRFGLEKPGANTNSAIEVAFETENGKHIASIWLGKLHLRRSSGQTEYDTSWPDGRYLLADTNSNIVALVAETFSQVEPKPERWINKEFFKVNKPKRISVQFPEPTNSWSLVRDSENADWKLEDAQPKEKLDSAKASSYNYVLSWPTFNDVLPLTSNNLEILGLTNPIIVTIETFENFRYVIKVGPKTNEAHPVIVHVAANIQTQRTPKEDEKPEEKEKLDKEFQENVKKLQEKLQQEQELTNWVYLVPSWNLDTLLRERHQLLSSTEEEDTAKQTESGENQENNPPHSSTSSTSQSQTSQTNVVLQTSQTTNRLITSDIIKVPSAEELKKGAKIEIIKADEIDKYLAQSQMTNTPTSTNSVITDSSTNATPNL